MVLIHSSDYNARSLLESATDHLFMEAFTFLIKNQLMTLLLMDAMANKLFRFIANVVSCYCYDTNCYKNSIEGVQ